MEQELAQDVHLSHYWNIVVKRWRVAAIIVAVVLVGTFVASYFTKPLYRAKIVLQIEREYANRITVEDLFGIAPSNQEFLQTQYALLKSRGLAENVVDNLALVEDPELNPGGTEGMTEDAIRALRDRLAGQIVDSIQVQPIEYTSLVNIVYVSMSPELAQKIGNGIGDSYINMNIERKFETVRQASTFLRAEINQLQKEVEQGERELQKFTASRDIVSLEGSGNLILEKLDALNASLSRAQAARMEKEATYNSLLNASPNSISEANNVVIQGLRADLLRAEREYEQKLSRLKPEHPDMIRLQEEIDGSRRNLTRAIEDVVTNVRESARKDYESALNQERALQRALDEQKEKATELNLNAVDYLTIKNTVDSKRNLMNELTRQLNETEVSARLKGSNVSNIHFVERAQRPGGRFNATTARNLKNAIPLGIVLGFATIFFLEYMDRSIKSPEELERITGFASLGVIPAAMSRAAGYGYGYGARDYLRERFRRSGSTDDTVSQEEEIEVDLIPHTNSRSPIAEAYRAFRTALLLSSATNPRLIVITSSMPREGKTTTTVNLATVLAQMNRRVLVVDADLRKPRVKKIFKSRDHAGLVNYLAAKVPLEDIVQESHVPNLFFVESGPIPPNPSELLAAESMRDLTVKLRDEFDFVLLDSPPVLAVTDAVILGTYADGVVLCAHGGETPREVIKRAAERLRQANVRVLGALLNNLNLQSHGYRYAKQYYEYYYQDQPGTGRTASNSRTRSKAS